MECPHCKKPINPASEMGKLSAQKRNTNYSELAKKRWYCDICGNGINKEICEVCYPSSNGLRRKGF